MMVWRGRGGRGGDAEKSKNLKTPKCQKKVCLEIRFLDSQLLFRVEISLYDCSACR